MAILAGLDVSDKTTHLCVVDADGIVLKRDVVASDPEVLAKWLGKHCPGLARVVLETGPLSTFLYHGLVERGVPVECICARHAKGVLAARVNKSDVHDAEGLSQLARTGWFKRVHMKASATHIDRAALRIRARLITTRVAMGMTITLCSGVSSSTVEVSIPFERDDNKQRSDQHQIPCAFSSLAFPALHGADSIQLHYRTSSSWVRPCRALSMPLMSNFHI
ncbi:MAG TPA: transposase [Croceibacterium sp.]|jgi:transposase|nr:transposase [Croceibacterium sp.]